MHTHTSWQNCLTTSYKDPYIVFLLAGCRSSPPPQGKFADVVVRSFIEPILDVRGFQQKTVTKGRLSNDKANGNGKRRLQCAALP